MRKNKLDWSNGGVTWWIIRGVMKLLGIYELEHRIIHLEARVSDLEVN